MCLLAGHEYKFQEVQEDAMQDSRERGLDGLGYSTRHGPCTVTSDPTAANWTDRQLRFHVKDAPNAFNVGASS